MENLNVKITKRSETAIKHRRHLMAIAAFTIIALVLSTACSEDEPTKPTSTQISEFKLTASDAAAEDLFGESVSISGDYAVVGAFGDDDDGTASGSAYIFVRDGQSWTQQAKLTASDAEVEDWFGWSVSISGDYAIVGGIGGSAYIFVRNEVSWTEQAILTASGASSVSISGDYAIVGGLFGGSASVFVRNGLSWSEQAILTPSGASSVSISGNYAIVGGFGGSASVFVRDGQSWSEQAILTASGASSVSISGNYAIVGAAFDDDDGDNSGSASIFVRDGLSWTEQAKLTASDAAASDQFGWSVSISGDYVIVGALFDSDDGPASGSAYVYSGIASL